MQGALFCLFTGFAAASPVYAQTPPDALRQQIEQGREIALPQQLQPAKPAEPAAMLAPTGSLLVTVTAFRLIGNTLIGTDQLYAALSGFLNRPLDYNELQSAAAVASELYRRAGWVVRTYLPEQDMEGGVVTIRIAEAVFGGVQVDRAPQRGELFSATANHTEGRDYLRLGATLPVGFDGWRLGANVSTMNYRLVLAAFAALNTRGSSDSDQDGSLLLERCWLTASLPF